MSTIHPTTRAAAQRRRQHLWLPVFVLAVVLTIPAVLAEGFNGFDLLVLVLLATGAIGFVTEVKE